MKKAIFGLIAFGVFFLAIALALPPAQARGFGMVAHYKYLLGLHRHQNDLGTATDSMGHGVQIDFMWPLGRYEEGTKIPSHAVGFSVAGGALTDHVVTGEGSPRRISDEQGGFYRFSILYEFFFDNGLGLSAGLGGGHIIGEQKYGALGFTDLGIKYHIKNGLVFSFTTDLMVDPVSFSNAQARYHHIYEGEPLVVPLESNYYAFVLGVAAGIGYYF